MKGDVYIKENLVPREPLSPWWLTLALLATGTSLLLITRIDHALPEPLTRSAPPDRFIGEIAHEHLVNLTSIGPRVAGSYENEVLGIGIVVEAVKRIAAGASPHHRIELDLHLASGAFPLEFLDGMNNVYKDVSSVVVRLSAAGEKPARSALLLNCHIDSVPDSPGASDDGAGCAVMLETMRALAATNAPLRHDALFLLNGAEENILQASHGFVTRHPWAGAARAFLNVEACGAGGREVLFQAGPHDPWLVEQYGSLAPHPFASSLAQELFESGLIPADTDFRIFRDFGGMSGVDFAWSSNGYVYHTFLDSAERVSPAVLQRTGDNVLALARGILGGDQLDEPMDREARQPVFFDLLGITLISVRAPVALAAVAATLIVVVIDLYLNVRLAARQLGMGKQMWRQAVVGGGVASVAAYLASMGAAAGSGLLLHFAGARMSWFAQPLLLAPLFAVPALVVGMVVGAHLCPTPAGGTKGWWRPRALYHGILVVITVIMSGMVAAGMRSSFLPLLWVALPAGADLVATLAGSESRVRWWAAGALLPMLETWYLTVGSLQMFVPVAGRAGATIGPLPTDVVIGVLTATLTLTACSWLLPLAVATRNREKLIYVAAVAWVGAVTMALIAEPYSESAPQRMMVFHTRRTVHSPGKEVVDHMYWVPELDANTARTLHNFVKAEGAWRPVSASECSRWLYCGVPYYLPVLALLPASRAAPAPPRAPTVRAAVSLHRTAPHAAQLELEVAGPAHTVVVVAPAAGLALTWSSLVERPLRAGTWGAREVYFFSMFRGRGEEPWRVQVRLEGPAAPPEGEPWAQVSVAGHSLFGTNKTEAAHAALLARLPRWVAPTGWGVDLHLFEV